MIMEEMTSAEFAFALEKTRTAILPLGALEEHGVHLPLMTDTMHMAALARAVAAQVDVLVAPAIPYGLCRSSSQHPGTVSIGFDTLRALIRDIGRSLYEQGIRALIIASGHAGRGHQAAMIEAGEDLNRTCPELTVAVLTVVDLLKDQISDLLITPNDAHAGELETSIVLFLSPHLVKGRSPREYPRFPGPILVRDKKAFWPGGVWGDPGAGNAEQGRHLIERGTRALVRLVTEIATFAEASSPS